MQRGLIRALVSKAVRSQLHHALSAQVRQIGTDGEPVQAELVVGRGRWIGSCAAATVASCHLRCSDRAPALN